MSTEQEVTNYEKLVITIFQNGTFKILSAIDLYLTKYSFNESYFLAIIAQEELAKLVMLPIAKELDEIEEIISRPTGSYYKHPIKQKVFTNYGLQNRSHEDIEAIKQSCLYVGTNLSLEPQLSTSKPEDVLKEIKYAALFLTYSCRTILFEKSFSEKTHKTIQGFMAMVYGAVVERLPEIHKDILREAEEVSKKSDKEKEEDIYKYLFTNPYELIKIFKAAFKEGYKTHLKKVKYFSLVELDNYLNSVLK